MKQSLSSQLIAKIILSLIITALNGCSSTPRTQTAAVSDPDAFHKSMRALPKVTNAEVGGYATSLTDELNATLNDRTIIKAIVLERYKNEATIKLIMDDDACFGSLGNSPKKDCTTLLLKMGGLLSTYHQTTIQIVGHTDNQGSKSKKIAISKQRAEAISSAFTKQGLSSKRVAASGIGPEKPIFSNNTEKGRQLNRRVELVINIIKEPSTKAATSSTVTPNKPESAITTVKPLIKATSS